MTKASFSYNPHPYPWLYVPQGAMDGWNAAKALAGSSQATILFVGDSILTGGGATDIVNNNAMSRIKAALSATYATYADFWGYAANSKLAYAGVGTPANAPFQDPQGAYTCTYPTNASDAGWTRSLIFFGTGATPATTFTTPYACTDIDIVHLDISAGTWKYRVDGGTLTTVTNVGNGSTNGCIKRISLTGLANTTHTVDIGWFSGSGVATIQGCATYPNGRAAGGIGYGRLSYGFGEMEHYANPSGSLFLFDRILPYSGMVPQGPYALGTITTPTYGAATSGGSIDAGTHLWGVVLVGSPGETAIGGISGTITIVGGTQTQPLTAIPLGTTNVTTQRRVYRTKAGTSSPFYLDGIIADNTTTTYTASASDASLTQVYPSLNAIPAQAATGFGFPTTPNLMVIEFGTNDNNNGRSEVDFRAGLERFVRAARRGNPTASVIILGTYYPFLWPSTASSTAYAGFAYSDVTGTTSFAHGDGWQTFQRGMRQVADLYGCVYIDMHARWGSNPVSQGFMVTNDIHPTDTGHQDIANALLSIL